MFDSHNRKHHEPMVPNSNIRVGNDVYKMLAVSMYLIVDDLLAGIELYGHIFDVYLLGIGTGEMLVENKSVPCIEEIISSCTIDTQDYFSL